MEDYIITMRHFEEGLSMLSSHDICSHFGKKINYDFDETERILYVHEIAKPTICPNCTSENFNRKGKVASRSVYDILDKQPVKLFITRHRYLCKECHRSFIEDLYPEKIKYTDNYENYIAQTMINENLSYRETAQRYGISIGFISEVLDSYIKRFKNQKFQLESCKYLYFHKFFYHGTACCCVCGSNHDDGSNLKLLEIYDEYSPKLAEIVFKKLSSIDSVKVIFHDYEPPMTAALKSEFKRHVVIIHRQNFLDQIHEIEKEKNRSTNFDPDGKIANQILQYTNYITKNLCGINVAFHLKNELFKKAQEVQDTFSDLISKIDSYSTAFRNLRQYREAEINASPITNLIKNFNDNNTDFQVMYIRMMILSKALRKKLKKTYLGTYLTTDPATTFCLTNLEHPFFELDNIFYTRSVDVDELVSELHQEQLLNIQDNAQQDN